MYRYLLLGGAFWLACVGTASAQSDEQRAMTHFQSGTAYFQVADYGSALEEYSLAYELSNRPALMYNIYLCHERLGHLEESEQWLARYLAEEPEAPERDNLEARLRTMRRRLAERPDESEVEETLAVASQPEPRAMPTETVFEVPTGAVVAYVTGGAALLGFAGVGTAALVEDARLEGECAGMCDAQEVEHLQSLVLGTDVLLSMAGVGLAVGLIWMLVDGQHSVQGSARGVTVAPWVSRAGAGCVASSRF